ncbi:MFS transporter [Geodermatophilus aquaeductus]|uniref:Major Facilitator Superfamily protein n=1 Tax=Geodermatophilus aquaeductus TaxID=1564161 RepID=A0A521E0T6_9ACTN|nr:MFS transporter [Geodermatophilus aquaeductus]SMO77577.1 Major Facilitator Superfamily protein [Geodermatophilus aquaeductus]
MTRTTPAGSAALASAGAVVLPLALAQFIASYAGSNMNVAITTIADDLDTEVAGIQTTITLFTLTMAALMIPGSKLTDIWGRKVCFVVGLVVYGTGALLASFAQGLGLLIVGYSVLEGIGSALLIPPIYILVTVLFQERTARARFFGVVSGAAGLGAAAGPLIGGLVTSTVSWRASFWLQVLVVAAIALLARRIVDPPLPAQRPRFDGLGAVLSALGMFFVVFGVLQSGTYGWLGAKQDVTVAGTVLIPEGGVSPVWPLMGIGVVFLGAFVLHVRSRERAGRAPLVSLSLFANKVSNLGLTTQTLQWLVLQGAFFVISVFLQQVRGYSAIETGLVLLPATVGVLATSAIAARMAQRHSARRLIRGGFGLTVIGLGLILALGREQSAVWTLVPGLFLLGAGIGIMLTASVNLVQSSWPEAVQGDISGVSRSVSNLGSSLGVAIAGSILVVAAVPGGTPFAAGIIVLGGFALVGVVVALLIPRPAPVPDEQTA